MRDFLRLLRFVRPYTVPLLASVVFMAVAGAAHAMIALLVRPILDRVLEPTTPDAPVELFSIFGTPIYLDSLVPPQIHNVWTMTSRNLFEFVLSLFKRCFFYIEYIGHSELLCNLKTVLCLIQHGYS